MPKKRPIGGTNTFGAIYNGFVRGPGSSSPCPKNNEVPTTCDQAKAGTIFDNSLVIDLCCGTSELVKAVTLEMVAKQSTLNTYVGMDTKLKKDETGFMYGIPFHLAPGDCTNIEALLGIVLDSIKNFRGEKITFLINAVDTIIPGTDVCLSIADNVRILSEQYVDSREIYVTGFNSRPTEILLNEGLTKNLYFFCFDSDPNLARDFSTVYVTKFVF